MSYDEVKSLSDEYFLPCKNVYELHAEFNSLMNISQQERLQDTQLMGSDEEHNSSAQAKDKGIPVEYFLRTSTLLKDKHPTI